MHKIISYSNFKNCVSSKILYMKNYIEFSVYGRWTCYGVLILCQLVNTCIQKWADMAVISIDEAEWTRLACRFLFTRDIGTVDRETVTLGRRLGGGTL